MRGTGSNNTKRQERSKIALYLVTVRGPLTLSPRFTTHRESPVETMHV